MKEKIKKVILAEHHQSLCNGKDHQDYEVMISKVECFLNVNGSFSLLQTTETPSYSFENTCFTYIVDPNEFIFFLKTLHTYDFYNGKFEEEVVSKISTISPSFARDLSIYYEKNWKHLVNCYIQKKQNIPENFLSIIHPMPEEISKALTRTIPLTLNELQNKTRGTKRDIR